MSKKYVVVTGASSGIGKATAQRIASENRNLILVARREKELFNLKNDIKKTNPNIDIVIKKYNLSQISDLENFYLSLKKYPIDIWINNAGFGRHQAVSETQIADIIDMVELNVEALAILSTLFVKDHKDDADAQLINISSLAGYFTIPNVSLYSGTKFFVSAFTEGLAHELKINGHRMRAKVMAPGATATEFAKIADNKHQEVNYQERYGTKFNTSEELAEFIWKLIVSDANVGIVNDSMKLDLFPEKLPYFSVD